MECSPDAVDLRLHLADLLIQAGSYTEALAHCSIALARDASNAAALNLLQRCTAGLAGEPALGPIRKLMYGPPGCGKTYLARAVAGELGANFYAVGIADVLQHWLGDSERALNRIFDTARRNAPCVQVGRVDLRLRRRAPPRSGQRVRRAQHRRDRLARSKWSVALGGFLGAARLDPDLGDLARRDIGIALTRLLRFGTVGVILLAWLISVSVPSIGQGTSPWLGRRIAMSVGTVALFGYLVWLSRVVPVCIWRSVLRTQRVLTLRVGLIVCAISIAVLAAVADGLTVVVVVGPVLLLAGILVTLIGRFSGG